MSYSRWSTSHWYAFYNTNGCLSLWYDMEHTIDIEYDDAVDMTKEDVIRTYGCTEEEATEAMRYIAYFIEDYEETIQLEKHEWDDWKPNKDIV